MDHDEPRVPITEALEWQHDYVRRSGSPTAALILRAVIDDLEGAGPMNEVLPAQVRFADLPGLRVMAAVHRLALDRRVPTLALWLPTLGGRGPRTPADEGMFGREVIRALTAHREVLESSMARTPQTNETGRARLLRCALSREDPARAVRLFEIGASAGLNLRADLLPGDPALEAGPLPRVVVRRGCDLDPVDISTVAGRSLLGSYVWVDDVDRFHRLARAMEIARDAPADLVRMDAAEFVAGLGVEAGTTTVLWHSAMWIYLPEATRAAVESGIRSLASNASPDAPFVHVSWEWDPSGAPDASFELVVTRWAGTAEDGVPRLIAQGRSHGEDVQLISP